MNISYNKKTLLLNGEPWMPTMGEMQFSRTNPRHWKENLAKMKAGGIDIVSSYVFWIHHEEIEGRFCFDGQRNLRKFLRLVKESGLYMFLRMGPWVHGEARNGGFPDWLYCKEYDVHGVAPEFIEKVRIYFKKLYDQCEGYFYEDGGPIIGIQIDNEYGHAGGWGGKVGQEFFAKMEEMIPELGFRVPIYTATGWGGAITGKCVPVWGGYCDAPWEAGNHKLELNKNYVFRANLNDSTIASDSGVKKAFSTVTGRYPYLTAELGGGIHATQNRRPIATKKDLGAMSVVNLGKGANLLGYYVYCGGNNPKGFLTGLQEYRIRIKSIGCASNMPELDYDFQSPISNCGTVKPSYGELKKFALFTRCFGKDFTPMDSFLPENNYTDPYDTEHLRYAYRHNGKSGYLIINNFQRHLDMNDFKVDSIKIPLDDEVVEFNDLTVNNGDYMLYPFNMKIGSALLKTAKATPLCILNGKTYVFYTDYETDYHIEGDLGDCEIVTITEKQAHDAYMVNIDGVDHLFISESVVLQDERGVYCFGEDVPEFAVYPDLNTGFENCGKQGVFTLYRKEIEKKQATATFKQTDKGYVVSVEYPKNTEGEEYILNISYIGDKGKLFVDKEFVADQYCNGLPWRINLTDLDNPKELLLTVSPIYEEEPVYIEVPVEYTDGEAAYVNDITVSEIYRNRI